jgi:hypothetical protein
MALAAAPFGFKPYGGKQFGTVQVTLIAANAEIGIGDPICALADGCDLLDEALNSQVQLIGFSTQYVAASAGGRLEVWKAEYDNIFMAQASTVASTAAIATEAAAANTPLDIVVGTINATTKHSTNAVVYNATSTNAPLICRGYAQIPGNTVGSATSYPILLCSVNRAVAAKAFIAVA